MTKTLSMEELAKNVSQEAQPSGPETTNNGKPYSLNNLGPILKDDEITCFLTAKCWPGMQGSIRLSANFYVLVYLDYTPPKDELLTFLKTLGNINDETVISHNHKRTFVYLKFIMDKNKYWNSQVKSVFDHKGNSPLVWTFATRAGKSYVRNWIEKADPSFVEKTKDQFTVFDQVKECKDEVGVLQVCGKPSDVSGLIQAYDIVKKSKRKTDQYILNYQPWGWQLALIKLIWQTPEERDIYWFWNNVPKLGKSTIGYLLMAKYPDYFHVICNPSFGKDTSTNLSNAQKRGWNGHCLILNLTMSYDGMDWLFSVLEMVKDSVLSTSKYSGESWIKGCTHLVVFANFGPYPYDKNGKALIDPGRLKVVKIPEPGTLGDPNNPREIKPIPLPVFNTRPEDEEVVNKCLAKMTSGSDIKPNITKPKQKTGLEGIFDEPQGPVMPTVQAPLQVEKKVDLTDPVKSVVKNVIDYSKLLGGKKDLPKVPEPKWVKYLCLCKCKEVCKCENSRNEFDVLFNSMTTIRSDGISVCRKQDYCNFAMWTSIPLFYKYYKSLDPLFRNMYEIIPDHFLQKPYFDLDIPAINMSETDSKLLVAQIEAGIMKVEPEIQQRDIMIFSSHSITKRSYHIVVDRWYVTNHFENKKFHDLVVEHVEPRLQVIYVEELNEKKEKVIKEKKVIDPVVYKPNQQFRLYGSTKYNANRPKILADQNKWQYDEKFESKAHEELSILRSSLIIHNTGWKPLKIVADAKKKMVYEALDYSDSQIDAIQAVVESKLPGVFSYNGSSGGGLHYKRNRRAYCSVCDRDHDHESISVYMKPNDLNVYFHCYRADDTVKNKIGFLGAVMKM